MPRLRSLSISLLVALTLVLAASCSSEETECHDDDECPAGQRCVFNTCEERPPFDAVDDLVAADGVDGTISSCDGVTPVSGEELRINEIHAAPLTTEDDTNCDGAMDSGQDEFIEIVNNGETTLDLAGVAITVNGNTKHTLSGCLQPKLGMVIYSGGLSRCEGLGSTQAIISEKSLILSNTGAVVSLRAIGGEPLDEVVYPNLGTSHSSWARAPDFTGDFVQHRDVTLNRFSAGTCLNGEELVKGCIAPDSADDADTSSDVITTDVITDTNAEDVAEDVAPPCPAPALTDLVLNEVLYNPAALPGSNQDGGDSNCDAARDAYDDEFVEVVNTSDIAVNLKGVQLFFNGTEKVSFETDRCLDPKQALIIYGGGAPACASTEDDMVVMDRLSLTNTGGVLILLDANQWEFTLGSVSWSSGEADGESLQRSPDLTGTGFVPYTSLSDVGTRLQSPGTCIGGESFATGCSL